MTALLLERSISLTRRVPGRALLLLALVAAAYHYSLQSLLRGLTLQTPLAYLGLVPIIALGLGWLRAVQRPTDGPYDLRLDFSLGRLLGAVLIGLAIGMATIVPRTSGIGFWLLRIDLLSMPVFVAGAVALLYGVRRLWSLRFPILFLFLAWPAPYVAITGDAMRVSVDATVAVLGVISAVLPLATAAGGSPGLFLIGWGDQAIPVSVATACSGINSVVGFGIMGAAMMAVMRGTILRRAAWLAAGLVLIWLLNLLRIELIFLVGAVASPQVALGVLHPVAGLIVFNVGIVIMILVAARFGLAFEFSRFERQHSAPSVNRRRLGIPIAIVAAAALTMSFVNAGYAGFQPIGGDHGLPAITGFRPSVAWVPDWSSRFLANYQHGRQFFGEHSSWTRSVYAPLDAAAMQTNVPVYVDVITTDEAAALAGYTVEACYSFHGYTVESSRNVPLMSGLDARVSSYADPRNGTDWTILFWEWPYQERGAVRYERVVLLMPDGDQAMMSGIPPADDSTSASARFGEAEQLLVTLGQTMVSNQLGIASASGQN
jgi:exosortase/archaeosortase family protein